MTMANEEYYGYDYARNQIARQMNPIRNFVKSRYINRVLQHVKGLAVDLGCGAGQILERLPSGSLGIEINPYLIEYLAHRGLRVLPSSSSPTGFNLLQTLNQNEFGTLVLSHVIEHFDNADQILRSLLNDCSVLGITTVILVVPGAAGFRSDPTHKTFVDIDYLQSNGLLDFGGFYLSHHSYFPGNFSFIGNYFSYHELMLVYSVIPRV